MGCVSRRRVVGVGVGPLDYQTQLATWNIPDGPIADGSHPIIMMANANRVANGAQNRPWVEPSSCFEPPTSHTMMLVPHLYTWRSTPLLRAGVN